MLCCNTIITEDEILNKNESKYHEINDFLQNGLCISLKLFNISKHVTIGKI